MDLGRPVARHVSRRPHELTPTPLDAATPEDKTTTAPAAVDAAQPVRPEVRPGHRPV